MLRSAAAAALLTAVAITASAIPPAGASVSAGPAQRTIAKAAPGFAGGADPFLWLEDKDGARSMAWVHAQNARTLPVLERDPHYAALYAQALKINEFAGRIPYPQELRGQLYNFWQDAAHVRGVWRRTTLQSYRTSSPLWS
ncbi:MAG: S9 family peptidase, partial [Candidatus Baltobacteraceae bacterium]